MLSRFGDDKVDSRCEKGGKWSEEYEQRHHGVIVVSVWITLQNELREEEVQLSVNVVRQITLEGMQKRVEFFFRLLTAMRTLVVDVDENKIS